MKQHVKIVPVPGQIMPPVLSTSKAPAKAPVTQENKQVDTPPTETPKEVESTKPAPSPITLALRQVGQEAAQKAKDNKKKAPETRFDGGGEAESVKEDAEAAKEEAKPTAVPSHITVPESPKGKDSIEATSPLKSPTSPRAKGAKVLESIQSPTSTAWKPTDIDPPIRMHRGSTISKASAEEIRQIEEAEAIQEEDEEEDDEESDEK